MLMCGLATNLNTLEDIKVSDTAEMMYKNSYIKVGNIKW